MLTFQNLSSASEATKYYCQTTSVYSSSGQLSQYKEWFGKGAQELGLFGEIKDEDFYRILEGKITDDDKEIQLGSKNGDEILHAAGVDFTFASPKSVSLLANIGEDSRIKDIEINAAKKVIDHIQKEYVYTRIKEGGNLIYQKVDNVVAGLFYENLNRDNEWHNHIHAVFANMVKAQDGKWRSAYFPEIVKNHIHLGKLYRSELALALQKIGYEIEISDHNHFFFEVKGVDQDLIKYYSQRTEKIVDKALELNEELNPKVKQIANLLTREQKISSPAEIIEIIKDKVSNFIKKTNKENIVEVLKSLIGKTKENQNQKFEDNLAKKAVGYAINHLSERKTVFALEEVLDHALDRNFGKIDLLSIKKEIHYLLNKEFLLKGQGKYQGARICYTTRDALEREKAIIATMKSTQNSFKPIISEERADELLKDLKLNSGQKNAAKLILTSTDKIYAIQGYAGTGKTHMLSQVKSVLEIVNKELLKQDRNHVPYELVGLAPSGAAVKELEKKGIKAQTLQSLLTKFAGYAQGRGTLEGLKIAQKQHQNKIFVVDEASMISAKQMQDLMTISSKLNFRTPLIGDTRQLLAVEAGNSFYELQREGMKTIKMDEIIRQQTQVGKAISYSAYAKDFEGIFDKIGTNLVDCSLLKEANHLRKEIIANNIKIDEKIDYNNPDKIKQFIKELSVKGVKNYDPQKDSVNSVDTALAAAKLYTSFSKEKRQGTLMLAQSNDTKNLVNKFIREILIKNKELGKASDKVSILINDNLSVAQRGQNFNYKVGRVILFNKANPKLNIKKNEYFVIESIENNNLKLRNLSNSARTLSFNPELAKEFRKNLEVYRQKEKEFRVGEEVVFTRKIEGEKQEIVNATTGKIKAIKDNSYLVTIEGKDVELGKSSPALKHIDYSYCRTTHKGQGATAKTAIVITESWWNSLTDDRNLLVQATRQQDELFLIVDNKEAVINKIAAVSDNRQGAIDFAEDNNQSLVKKLELKQRLFAAVGGKEQFRKYQIALKQAKFFDDNIENRKTNPKLPEEKIDSKLKISENIKNEVTAIDLIIGNRQKAVLELESKIKNEFDKIVTQKIRSTNKQYQSRPKKHFIAQFSDDEIKEHFINDVKARTDIDIKDIEIAINEAFSNPNKKIYFGLKKKSEICWHGEAGYVKNYKTGEYFPWGINNIKVDDKSKLKEISKEELKEKQKQAEELKQKALEEKLKKEQEIAIKAKNYFDLYSKNGTSSYLKRKGIDDVKIENIRFSKNRIIVPVQDQEGKIWSLQYISKDGTKKFLKDGKKVGNFFLIKNNNDLKNEEEIYLAEGFATAASIFKATNKPVAVCFDAGNIEHALKNLKEKYPNKEFTIAADNDAWKEVNTGKDKAVSAAKKFGAKLALPQFNKIHDQHKPTDFNDLHKLEGIEAVRKQISDSHEYHHSITQNPINHHINHQNEL